MHEGHSDSLIIREASDADAADISRLLMVLGYKASPETVRDRFGLFISRGNGTVLVGEQSGELIAVAALELTFPLHAEGPVLHLSALAVAERWQGKGVGRRMIEEIEAWAKQKGCKRIVVTSAEHRNGAHAFYPAVGWGYTGRRFGKMLEGSFHAGNAESGEAAKGMETTDRHARED